MWECSVSKIISRLLSFLFKCLFQKSYHCLPLKDENMGNYYAKSIIYLTKLSKTFWYNPRGKVFFSYSYIEHVSRKLLSFISTCSKEKANSSARIFYYQMWWQQKSLCMHRHSCGQKESFCWKVLVVLPSWDVCAGSSDHWLMSWTVTWESWARDTFVLILCGIADSPVLLLQGL